MNGKVLKKHCFMFTVILLMLAFAVSNTAAASATSGTYALDLDGFFYRTQDAYLPTLTITDLGLRNPGGIAAHGDNLYIADTGNRRILIYNVLLDKAVTIEHEEFASPSGIHVSQSGDIYVADSRAGAVFHFGSDHIFLNMFGRPDDPAFGPNLSFNPVKVGADRRGNLYIVSEGLGDGVIHLDNSGGFLGFFTSNKTGIGIVERLQDLIFTPEIKSRLFPRLPPIFSGLFVDESTGLVYTTAFNSPGSSIKKHNIAGQNMIGSVVDLPEDPIAISVDATGTMYAAYQRGTIAVFSDDGRILFRFGAHSGGTDISGLFSRLADLAVDDRGNIWAVDSDKGYLQRFTPTDYALDIQNAVAEYRRGDYSAARSSWEAVLTKNEMSILAHSGLAQINMLQQNYRAAASEYALAGDREAYSQAFWEVRNEYLQRNIGSWIMVIIIFFLFRLIWKQIIKRTAIPSWSKKTRNKLLQIKLIRDIAWVKMVLLKPADAFYEIKLHRRGSPIAATILLTGAYLVFLFDNIGRGFIFQNRQVITENLPLMSGAFIMLMGLFIIGNTLVASINDGNGKFSDVLTMTGYALSPAIILIPLSTLLSNVLTNNEAFIYVFLRIIAFTWSFITISIGIAETHEYLYRDSLKNILLTLFFMVISFLSMSIIVILGSRFGDFVLSIFKEVWLRA